MPADDLISAELAQVREHLADLDKLIKRMDREVIAVAVLNAAQDRLAAHVPHLLAAVDALLALHSPRTDTLYGRSCFTHQTARNSLRPVPGCEQCVQDRPREVCPECRDQYGDPVPFDGCRARAAALAALTGKGESGA